MLPCLLYKRVMSYKPQSASENALLALAVQASRTYAKALQRVHHYPAGMLAILNMGIDRLAQTGTFKQWDWSPLTRFTSAAAFKYERPGTP